MDINRRLFVSVCVTLVVSMAGNIMLVNVNMKLMKASNKVLITCNKLEDADKELKVKIELLANAIASDDEELTNCLIDNDKLLLWAKKQMTN